MILSVRDSILKTLVSGNGEISGEKLAAALGVSRNAIWKNVNRLREEGFPIEGSTGTGYRMAPVIERVCAEAIENELKTEFIGREIYLYDRLSSTNDLAKEMARKGAGEGTVIIAREQMSGRGRFRRSYFSPKDKGLYFTILLRPSLPAAGSMIITVMTAVAVARAIDKISGLEAGINWVNDIYIDRKKVSGILCEAGLDIESGQLQYVAVGIGINVDRISFPEEISGIATSICNETDKTVDKNRLAALICNEMETMYRSLPDTSFVEEYRERSIVVGKRIEIDRNGERLSGIALRINDDASLTVEVSGEILELRSGEISVHLEKE